MASLPVTETLSRRTASGRPPAAGSRAARRRRRTWPSPLLLGGAALAAIVAVHLALAVYMRVPIIQPDELGYLQNARFLARGGPRSETEYYPGFSLLLVPLWWISTDPNVAFRGALVIEAGLAAVGAVLCWRLTTALVPDLAGWRRALVVALTLAYPSALLYTNFALAEVAFSVVFMAVVLIATRAFTTARPAWYALLGVTAGGLALVHPRGFAVVVAVAIFGLLLLGVSRATLRSLGALAGGIAAALVATRWLVTTTKGKVAPRFGAYRPDTVLSKSLSLHGVLSLFGELAGQLWYLSLASFGLVPLALLLGGRSLHRVIRGERSPAVVLQGFATLSFIGVWALSSLFMNLGDRADKLIYGRYNEGVILPLLLIALGELMRPREAQRHFRTGSDSRPSRRWLTTSVLAIVGTGAILQLGRTTSELHGGLNPANVLGLASLLNRMGDHIHVISMSSIILGVVVLLALVAWRLPALALLVMTGLFVWSAIDLQTGYLIPGTRARAQQNDIAMAISALEHVPGADLACVAWEQDTNVDYNFYNDRYLVPGQRIVQYDPTQPPGPCGTLVVSTDPAFATHNPGARIVTSESFVNQTLWAIPRPGDSTYAVLDAGGWLSPPTTTLGAAVAIPAADLHGSQIDTPDGTLTVRSGRTTRLRLTVNHAPGGAPWPSVDALHSGSGQFAVQVTATWNDSTASAATFNLPETLLPNQHVDVPVELAAVDANGRALPPGAYTVHFGLLQQTVGGFSDPGSTVTVHVTS